MTVLDRFHAMALALSGQPVPAPQFPSLLAVRVFEAPRVTSADPGLREFEAAQIWRALAAETSTPTRETT